MILYILLSGEPPIIANTKPKLIKKFKNCNNNTIQSTFALGKDAYSTSRRRARNSYDACYASTPKKDPTPMNSWKATGSKGSLD